MRRFLYLVLSAAGLLTTVPACATVRELDLADGSQETIVEPGEVLEFKLIHRVPKQPYSVKVQREFLRIPKEELALPASDQSIPDECKDFLHTANRIKDAEDEGVVKELVAEADDLLATGKCKNPEKPRQTLRTAIRLTEKPLNERFILAEGELVRITVGRKDGEELKEWIFVFTTSPGGRWETSYGFVFLGDQEETFFTDALEDETFKISPKDDRVGGDLDNLKFAPSFFYTWLPRRYESKDWHPGLTFGLGFNQSKPTLFLGGSLNHNRFVSLLAGLAINQQKRLRGEYGSGQILKEPLSGDALHEDKPGFSYFLGLSFRFSTNPFRNGDDSEPAQPAEPAEPAAGGS